MVFCIQRLRAIALVIALVVPLLGSAGQRASAGQIAGFTYISQSFGYAVVWKAPWFATERSDPLTDELVLSDSLSTVVLAPGLSEGNDVDANIELVEQALVEGALDATNVVPISPARCLGERSKQQTAVRCFFFDRRSPDGSTTAVAMKVQMWEVADGIHLAMVASVEPDHFDDYATRWAEIAVFPAGVAVPDDLDASHEERHGETTFVFDAAIGETEQTEIVEGTRFASDALDLYFGPLSLGEMRVTAMDALSPAEPWMAALTSNRSIALFAGADGEWRTSPPVARLEILTHELTHVYQIQVLGDAFFEVPRWFLEGSADVVAAAAIINARLAEWTDIDAMAGYQLTWQPVTEGLDDLPANANIDGAQYPLAFLGVRYALAQGNLSASSIGTLFDAIAAGASFDEAFLEVFGLSVDDYYVEFERWRAELPQVWERPPVYALAGDAPAPAEVTWGTAPSELAPGEQVTITAITEPSARCTLAVTLDGQVLQRETLASGDGVAFWLVSIPEDTAPTEATIEAACGSAPIQTLARIVE